MYFKLLENSFKFSFLTWKYQSHLISSHLNQEQVKLIKDNISVSSWHHHQVKYNILQITRILMFKIKIKVPQRLGEKFCLSRVTLDIQTRFVLANKEHFMHKTIKFAWAFFKNAKYVTCYSSWLMLTLAVIEYWTRSFVFNKYVSARNFYHQIHYIIMFDKQNSIINYLCFLPGTKLMDSPVDILRQNDLSFHSEQIPPLLQPAHPLYGTLGLVSCKTQRIASDQPRQVICSTLMKDASLQ